MSDILHGEGLERTDIETPFRSISFSHAAAEAQASQTPVVRVLPEVNVVKIGGQSIMDRGRQALAPLLDEVLAVRAHHQLLLCTGGGTRARHAYAVALDLGLSTSVLARLGLSVPKQNARMLQMLLARHGGILLDQEDLPRLPLYFALGCLPIMPGIAPFSFWEQPPATGRIPPHRTDCGVFLTAEFLGARSCLFVKDQRGLYTANPTTSRDATFIPRIGAAELLELDLQDLVLERSVVEYLVHARSVRQVQVLDGLEPGNLTRALAGEHVGTIIEA